MDIFVTNHQDFYLNFPDATGMSVELLDVYKITSLPGSLPYLFLLRLSGGDGHKQVRIVFTIRFKIDHNKAGMVSSILENTYMSVLGDSLDHRAVALLGKFIDRYYARLAQQLRARVEELTQQNIQFPEVQFIEHIMPYYRRSC